jgi:hypothetical protein
VVAVDVVLSLVGVLVFLGREEGGEEGGKLKMGSYLGA